MTLYTKTQFVSYSHCIMAMHNIYIYILMDLVKSIGNTSKSFPFTPYFLISFYLLTVVSHITFWNFHNCLITSMRSTTATPFELSSIMIPATSYWMRELGINGVRVRERGVDKIE